MKQGTFLLLSFLAVNLTVGSLSSAIAAQSTSSTMKPDAVFSSTTDGNEAKSVIDKDLSTRWSSQGENAWLVLDYGKTYEFNSIRIAFYKGDQRSSKFNVQVSQDGVAWNKVIPDRDSSGKTDRYERYEFNLVRARYVKYSGFGNSQNLWNSITEFNIANCKVNKCSKDDLVIK